METFPFPPGLNKPFDALVAVFEDNPIPEWKDRKPRIEQGKLIEHLFEQGITRLEARKLINYLIDRGVFHADDSQVDLRIAVSFDGHQTDETTPVRYLEITHTVWSEFQTSLRSQRTGQAEGDQCGTGQGEEDGTAPGQSGTARLTEMKQPEVTTAQFVTLDKMAAMVGRSKRTLEKLLNRPRNPFPGPDIEGGGGKPHEWNWAKIRPWLETEFGRALPEQFPGSRFLDGRADRN
jgi:hypothetical protein